MWARDGEVCAGLRAVEAGTARGWQNGRFGQRSADLPSLPCRGGRTGCGTFGPIDATVCVQGDDRVCAQELSQRLAIFGRMQHREIENVPHVRIHVPNSTDNVAVGVTDDPAPLLAFFLCSLYFVFSCCRAFSLYHINGHAVRRSLPPGRTAIAIWWVGFLGIYDDDNSAYDCSWHYFGFFMQPAKVGYTATFCVAVETFCVWDSSLD